MPARPEVTVIGPRRPSRPRLIVHCVATIDPREVRTRDGMRITSPVRTIFDLAATVTESELERAIVEAHVLGLVRVGELEASLERYRGRRGLGTVARVLTAGASTPTRNDLERAMIRLLDAARLPRPLINEPVGRHVPDFLWPAERLIVETDGWASHGHQRAFERDRARDASSNRSATRSCASRGGRSRRNLCSSRPGSRSCSLFAFAGANLPISGTKAGPETHSG
jgi:hypothetical protein